MLSVVAYGRNDSSGYNAHRRVALSLNCIAEVLDGVGDEIVFVDYNTPDGLPTLPESLADTLTEHCRSRLRVLRVRSDVHAERFEQDTPLQIVEPVARNVAVRRANPSNRWLLMTNTDMVFLPRTNRSLTGVCSGLADGFYVIPRFELPEWVWERLSRRDPERVLHELAELGPALRLDEVTTSHDWLRFDSAGDFQLVLRENFVAIDGFDESMVLGWHVDANLGKRMLLHRGSVESLDGEVAGYHCNHLRTASTYQRSPVANDLERFVVSCDLASVPAQRETWGLADVDVEEIDLTGSAERRFATAVTTALGNPGTRPGSTNALNEKWSLAYDSGHVLAHVADAIRVARQPPSVAYLGANPVLRGMLGKLVDALYGALELASGVVDADVVVVDLGVDSTLAGPSPERDDGAPAAERRRELIGVFDAFRALVYAERAAIRGGRHPRQFVLVNSAAIYWNAYCQAELRCGPTTPHSRVRRATVRTTAYDGEHVGREATRAHQLRRWITRRDADAGYLALKPGTPVSIDSLDDYAGFGSGWDFPSRTGVATHGPRAALAVSTADVAEPQLVLTFDGREPDTLEAVAENPAGPVDLSSELSGASGMLRWTVDLSPATRRGSVARLELRLGKSSPELHLVSIEVRQAGRSRLRQVLRASHSRRGRTTPRH